ncbi:MAG: SHOCT domain-containing protein [Erysipelotrichales bacterium]|nr:SHOCT domain-containing protein [Erysipelotrichales bacterium]
MARNIRVKPGKNQSIVGAIAGGLFVILGVVIVIPTFGLFGLIWTLFAVLITCTNIYNATSSKGVATHEIVIEDDPLETSSYSGYGSSPKERMEDLKSLYNSGLISREEYEEKRREILRDL